MRKKKGRLLMDKDPLQSELDAILDDIEETLKRHTSSYEIMSVDGDEDGLTFTVSAEYLLKRG
jgi:hypothetical protein